MFLQLTDVLCWEETIAAMVLQFLLSASYVQSYPAFQEEIPSFRILLLIQELEDRPVSKEIITRKLASASLFQDKINDLIDEGLLISENGNLYLTKGSRLLVLLFSAYRKWLGLDTGKG